MAEKRTRLTLPDAANNFPGIGAWGVKTPAEMIEQVREYAEYLRAQAYEIDMAADEHFQIEVVTGVHCPRIVKVLQKAKSPNEGAE